MLYKAIGGLTLSYITDPISIKYVTSYSLCSSNDFHLKHPLRKSYATLGGHSCKMAAPKVWNLLQHTSKEPLLLTVFNVWPIILNKCFSDVSKILTGISILIVFLSHFSFWMILVLDFIPFDSRNFLKWF